MDTTPVDVGNPTERNAAPAPAGSVGSAAPITQPARLKWLLGRVGWSALLTLGLIFLMAQVLVVSQGPTDFCTDYTSVQRVLQGLQPYIPLHCSAGAASFANGLREFDTHPPSSILLLLPFALLSLGQATVIWGYAALVAYLVSGALLLRELGWSSLRGWAPFVGGSILWLPFLFSETFLNFEQLLTLLIVVAWLLARRKRDGWSGWVLGMAGLLKLWPAALLLLPLVQRRWRPVLVGAVTLAGGTLLALPVVGKAAYAAYLGPVRLNETQAAPSDANVSLVGVVARLFTGIPPSLPPLLPGLNLTAAMLLAEGLAALFLAGVVALIWWSQRRGAAEAAELLSQGLLVTALLLAFPITWYWMLITLLVPGATTLLALRQLPRPPRWWFALLLIGLVPAAGPGWAAIRLPVWLQGLHIADPASWQLLALALPTAGLLCFAGAQAWLLWRACIPRRSSSDISISQHPILQQEQP